MEKMKEYAEIEVIKALDEAEKIILESAQEVLDSDYDKLIMRETAGIYRRAVERLLGIYAPPEMSEEKQNRLGVTMVKAVGENENGS